MGEVAKMEKIRERARLSVKPQDYPWISMLDIQLADLSEKISSFRIDAEEEIVELSNKKQEIRTRMDEHEEDTKFLLTPAGRYKPPNKEEVARHGWERYCAELQRAAIPPPLYTDANVLDAVRRHQDSVLKEDKEIFCADVSLRNDLEIFLKDKIVYLESVDNVRLAKKYKSMLVALGCEVDEEASGGQDANHVSAPGNQDQLRNVTTRAYSRRLAGSRLEDQ